MMLLDLREPINALSHGAGMMLALPLTWVFWQRCVEQVSTAASRDGRDGGRATAYQRGKIIALLIYGLSLVICFGSSALYHAVCLSGEPLSRLRRLDHVGIYLLIAGTYTPASWSLFRRSWRRGTLATVWSVAGLCSARIWFGGVLPTWMSTSIYLAMGWGVLFCYRELARSLSHRSLLPLPLGGAFYSVGALINLSGWPVLEPGVFGSHELFHFFVIAGSACHAQFMLRVVVPARQPANWNDPVDCRAPSSQPIPARMAGRSVLHSAQLGGSLFGRLHLASSPLWGSLSEARPIESRLTDEK
ncbi:MAG: hemolysin III family protein [Planctomycetaceae bacterium]|nr:hemolysin III family protein [Planctomycetaceae bacterium]